MSNLKSKYPPGTRVRLTGKFLRSTGQMAGGEGLSKWVVQECDCRLCKGGDFVRTDQPKQDAESMYTAAELAKHPSLRWRHIAKANLCAIGEITTRNCP